MKHFLYAMSILFLLLASACAQGYQRESLYGQWKGVSVQEEGVNLPDVDPTILQFQFAESGYTYQGNLNYREAGTFQVQSPYLYTTDTINQATTEKAVEILQLSEDSLHLRMMENGKERLLKLVRE